MRFCVTWWEHVRSVQVCVNGYTICFNIPKGNRGRGRCLNRTPPPQKKKSSNLISLDGWEGKGGQAGILYKGTSTITPKRPGVTDGPPSPLLYYSRAKNVTLELLFPLKLILALSYILLEAFIHFGDWRQNNFWNNESFFFYQLVQKSYDYFAIADNDLLGGGLSNVQDK